MKNIVLSTLLVFAVSLSLVAQETPPYSGKFEAIDRLIESPSPYRTASGTPGAEYWQQRADYQIKASIDEQNNVLEGEETITYYNNSPDALKFLWINLEQNINRKDGSDFNYVFGGVKDSISSLQAQRILRAIDFPAGTEIISVKDEAGKNLKYREIRTMMRLDLPESLQPDSKITFSIKWKNYITNRADFLLSREGYEYFPEDDNKVFLLGHWFPRMAVYNDTDGWQNKQFQKLGEFALEFGDYDVEITVPADHIVASTGALINESEVLSSTQIERLKKARQSTDKLVMIVTPQEARKNEKKKSSSTKTWKFRAENVRDVAFATSRKFIWDAMAVKLPTNNVLAMSFYPKEGLPVWTEESTMAIKNALEVYSETTFDYPYPVCISVNTSNIGIEYPMISFNGGRPVNGEISEGARRGMTSTIVHEVGHNWFPMIVSSDERKWMWMDEGLNTYVHQKTLAERYPQWSHTEPKSIVPFMKGDKSILRPIMTNADNDLLSQMGSNFYQKPTVGFQMLRNSIIGQELFDEAFKEYANRWKFKHPNPADMFRTIEDVTATDLDWFWRGWYFTTDNVDIELAEVKWMQTMQEEGSLENRPRKGKSSKISGSGNSQGNDFSNGPEMISVLPTGDGSYGQYLSRINEDELQASLSGKNIYVLTFKNRGGLVMPIIIEWTYADGTTEREVLPAEVWRHNEAEYKHSFLKEKEVISIVVDPNQEIADVDMNNNVFPKVEGDNAFEKFKKKQ
ncbi:MAG: M1 family metallopeptidase [Cytophagales bacterium]|nr:M1 family metallopeptidase [Cytophagales bacterium]